MKFKVNTSWYRWLMIFGWSLLSGTALAVSLPTATATGSLDQTYSYDGSGRLTSVHFSDGHTITYTYDDNGNILTVALTRGEGIFSDGFEVLAYLEELIRWQ
jgi:YD repeat-containing protein